MGSIMSSRYWTCPNCFRQFDYQVGFTHSKDTCRQEPAKDTEKLQKDFNAKFKGSTKPKPVQVYTGTEMVGVAQIPKSNAQPVFSRQAAKDTVKVK